MFYFYCFDCEYEWESNTDTEPCCPACKGGDVDISSNADEDKFEDEEDNYFEIADELDDDVDD